MRLLAFGTLLGMIIAKDSKEAPAGQPEPESSEPDADFVTDDGMELCVLCKRNTGVRRDQHVELRYGYVEGVGQLCRKCAR